MQNATDNQSNASNTSVQSDNSGVTGQLKSSAEVQMTNVAKEAQAQVANAGMQAQQQMQNLGQNTATQVQNLGQAGVAKAGELVEQVMNPHKENQPPTTKDEKVYATIAYIPFVALISIIIKPDSAYVRLHSKQGLLLSLLFFFVGMIAAIASLFGIIGQLLAFLLGLVPLACMVTAVYSMYLAASGFWWKIPVLSGVADLIPVEFMAKASKENITGQVGVAKTDYDVRQDAIKTEQADNQAPQTSVPVVNNATQSQQVASGGPSTTTLPSASSSSGEVQSK